VFSDLFIFYIKVFFMSTFSEPSAEKLEALHNHAKAVVKTVPELLKQLRENRQITPALLSQQTGLSVRNILLNERPETSVSLGFLVVVLEYYQVSLTDFIKEVQDQVALQRFTVPENIKAKRVPHVF